MPSLEEPLRSPGAIGRIFLRILQSLAQKKLLPADGINACIVPFGMSLGTFELDRIYCLENHRVLLLDFKSPERNIELPFFRLMKLLRLVFLPSSSAYDDEGGLEGKIQRLGGSLIILRRKSCLFGTLMWALCEVRRIPDADR